MEREGGRQGKVPFLELRTNVRILDPFCFVGNALVVENKASLVLVSMCDTVD